MRIFHYNDEEKHLHEYLAQHGHENVILPAAADPFATIRGSRFDAAFIGMHPNGLRLLRALHQQNPQCAVMIITSDRDTRMAVQSIKGGAFDYLVTPLDFVQVERTCIMMMRENQARQRLADLEGKLAAPTSPTRFVGHSEMIDNLRQLVAKAAGSSASVLITGETGTGKELVARLLHEQSSRNEKPFVSINCNAIPRSLLESELFGYRKGAFTGAQADRQGLLRQANQGTFFFDEISDLDRSLQGKILRVLQESEVLPVGGDKPEHLEVRFIAASNRNLAAHVRDGHFRDDLYYRLNVVPIHIPPLRERMEDVAPLVRYFLELHAQREGRQPLKVAPAVWRWLGNHDWPGNVRELENMCQRAVALTDGQTFSTNVLDLSDAFGVSAVAGTNRSSSATVNRGVSRSANQGAGDIVAARNDAERQLIEQALGDVKGNISRAARIVGISRTTLYAKIHRLGIEVRRTYR
jgi:DNA-binding NtrC family response regulator